MKVSFFIIVFLSASFSLCSQKKEMILEFNDESVNVYDYFMHDLEKLHNAIFGDTYVTRLLDSTRTAEYETVSSVDDVMTTILSKVCLLEADFDGTFTMLDVIKEKWCTVDSKVDVLSDLASSIDITVETIHSFVDVIDSNVDIVTEDISGIRVDDFGGTWTLIDAIQETLCAKFDTLFTNLNLIEQTIDTISGDQLAAFLGTCTMIESISDVVALNLSAICELAVDTASDVDSIESLIDILSDKDLTVCSKLDLIDSCVQSSFAGTFTMLDTLESKICLIDKSVDVLLELSSTISAIEVLKDKICTVDSQVDGLEEALLSICDDLETIESFVDPLFIKLAAIDDDVDALNTEANTINMVTNGILGNLATVESKIDLISSPSLSTVESKICQSDSIIDLLIDTFATIESKIDRTDDRIETIDSKVDMVDSLADQSLNKTCTIESKVAVIDTAMITIESQLDIFIAIESKIDVFDQALSAPLSKVCTIESKVDVINADLTVISNQACTIDNKVDLVCQSVVTVQSRVDIAQQAAFTVGSKVDVLDVQLASALNKVCTVESKVDVIDDLIPMAQDGAGRIESDLCVLAGDFTETWTIIDAIELKACTSDNVINAIESKVDDLSGAGASGDLAGTFTTLDVLQAKICSSESILDPISLQIVDLTGTFTVLDILLNKSCTIESALDSVKIQLTTDDSDIAKAIECLGTEITDADIGTTGFTISASGRYFLGEEVDYAASGAGNPAITISADNVTLDLCDKTLRQSNAQAGTEGIVISATSENVTIKNGAIREFSSDCIQVASGASGITLQDLRIIDAGDDGIDCVGIVNNIMINRVLVSGCTGNGIEFDQGAGIVIQDSMLVDNGVAIEIDPTSGSIERICILRCVCNGSSTGNIRLIANSGTISQVVVDSCCIFAATNTGITINQVVNSVFKNNFIASSGSSGFFLSSTVNDLQILNNVISNNGAEGIHVDDASAEDCSFQGNVFVINTSDNYREDINAGPQTVLNNFAIHTNEADNYSLGGGTQTTINKAIIDQGTGTFSTTPGKWRNISMTT